MKRSIYILAIATAFQAVATTSCGEDEEKVAVTSVTIDNKPTSPLTVNSEYPLTFTVKPDNATNKNVTWNSSNPAFAEVDANGKIKAKAAGETTISVTTVDGGKKDQCTVTVVTSAVAVTGVTIDQDEVTITGIGGTATLTAVLAPADATNQNVTWSSDDEYQAVITISSNGKVATVEAVGGGTATVTVTASDGSFTATCEITVEIPITAVAIEPSKVTIAAIDGTANLVLNIEPVGATYRGITWDSDNKNVATVNNNGVVTAKSFGKATITATVITVGGEFKATCLVNVHQTVTSVALDTRAAYVGVGEIVNLTVVVVPTDASNKNITWLSSNPAIVSVDQNGVAKAESVGTATITATSQDNEIQKDVCTIEVRAADERWSIEVSDEGHSTLGGYRLLDGENGPWAGGGGRPSWAIINFKAATPVHGISLFRHQVFTDAPKHIVFSTSSDKQNWETLIDTELPNTTGWQILDALTPKTAQYLKIEVKSCYVSENEPWRFHIGEICIKNSSRDIYPIIFEHDITVNNMTYYKKFGITTLKTTGNDPSMYTWELGRALNLTNGNKRVLTFEYKSPNTSSTGEIWFNAPDPVPGRSTGQTLNMPPATEWTRYEISLDDPIIGYNFGAANHRFRFDPVDNGTTPYEINMRFFQVEIYNE